MIVRAVGCECGDGLGDCVGDGFFDGVEEAGGFHLVVAPAEGVEVGDLGFAAVFGVGVVVFLDVVDLAGPGGGSGAAGDCADGEDQAQVFQHFGGGGVSVGGDGPEGSGRGRCGCCGRRGGGG